MRHSGEKLLAPVASNDICCVLRRVDQNLFWGFKPFFGL